MCYFTHTRALYARVLFCVGWFILYFLRFCPLLCFVFKLSAPHLCKKRQTNYQKHLLSTAAQHKIHTKHSSKMYHSIGSCLKISSVCLFFWSLSICCAGRIKRGLFQLQLLCKDDEQGKKMVTHFSKNKKQNQKQGSGILKEIKVKVFFSTFFHLVD